jgi:hypothetical protein
MDQKVVLPKFNVPGLRAHWMTRALWAVGALVVAQAVVFGVILTRRESSPATPGPLQATALPTSALPAPAATTPAATSAPPVPVPVAAAAAPTAPTPAAPALATESPARKARGAHHRSVAHHARRGGGRSVAAAGATRKSAAKSDELDDLLKRFK